MNRGQPRWSRRDFLSGLTLAGTAGLLGVCPAPVAAEPAPETTRLRFAHAVAICTAPQLIAADLLHGEGFTDVQYGQRLATDSGKPVLKLLAAGEIDFSIGVAGQMVRKIVNRGYTPRYDYALQALRDIPHGVWREYDPEDTLRFYALRLREAGMIKSSPQKILAQGTDWRFLNELKKELKG